MDAGRRRRANLQTYDLGVGFFGFFAVAFFVISLVAQLTGMDSIWASAAALLSFVIVALIWVFRRRFLQRSKSGA